MNALPNNSIINVNQASSTVASALAPHRATAKVTAKDTTNGTDGTGSGTNNAATDPSDITSSDFLTLLVSELKNQDPTQPTDPNAYITQLVGVNSLQQLIQINQGLTSVETPSTDTSSSNAVSGTASS
jgi:flagellar basal-body rod modification protein FlgD